MIPIGTVSKDIPAEVFNVKSRVVIVMKDSNSLLTVLIPGSDLEGLGECMRECFEVNIAACFAGKRHSKIKDL